MAGRGKSAGGDRVLESRHLIGLFLGVVLLCAVFFTLGYVMGRTQYGGSVHAETLAHKPAPEPLASQPVVDPAAPTTPAPNDWDFYPKNTSAKVDSAGASRPADDAVADTTTATSNAASEPPVPVETPAATPAKARPEAQAPRIAKASIILQVAALRHESDAIAMATVLQHKRFPSFVAPPVRGDPLYHVQVGPYTDEHAADAARAALDHDGFKVIIKR